MSAETTRETRAGFAAVIGAPNAGKSTLVNRLVGEKVSIVTHKVQTTRFQVRGVMMRDDSQVILVDTPGIFTPKRRLDRAMVRSAWDGADGADLILHVVDVSAWVAEAEGKISAAEKKSIIDDKRIIKDLQELGKKAILALNKVDLVRPDQLLPISAALYDEGVYSDVFMISGLKGGGVDALSEHLAKNMLPGPFLFPEDQAADMPSRLLAAEVTREKLMLRLHEELPYQLTVETENWESRKDGSIRIDQIIYVAREGHRKIILGKQGRVIREVGQKSREEMQDIFQRPVHLFTRIKISEKWAESRERFSAIGLDFDV
ncbi:MAG: GTPase Era [Hirschia sp.]|nr:GTPase Era [Hirschia sp.]MBF19994.1 GTPase Era [Hirschia sp.]|tara:strand:- start:393 stop:1346 length:954 start_codon:yes stop_codon:yes gene_type:complete